MGVAESVNIHASEGRSLDVLVSGPPDGTVMVFHSGTQCGLVPLPAGLDPAAMGIRTVDVRPARLRPVYASIWAHCR